ncbi:glutamine-hydrolyzing GMP synthase [Acanthopleuribacter pedis]|uniref:GMP synthase [glutamine-hydrolyzing] n=1 Tax=Acanthopleuribacter pedis TaxID=442870 RepID=A0A8J7QAI5_9BACT|nr:glutamine-hydrolyzing GMP synthase [Acanthopleuribacter pedis]MBO1320862.1 glutamine-hydrolyzing GMP synthase [Acanthopleuribacter pedis]
METQNKIAILDFGSQYTKLIARRIRELSIYSEILPYNTDPADLADPSIKGVILSGGPRSVFDKGAPALDQKFWEIDKPILGICYGLQLMCRDFNGEVVSADDREYGPANLQLDHHNSPLFKGFEAKTRVWMSHGDRLDKAPADFHILGTSENAPITAMAHNQRPLYGIQFHPEVSHSENGLTLIKNFVTDICGCAQDWLMKDYIEAAVEEIREQVGDDHVLLGLSGGVDSSVAAALIHKAIGDQLTCVFVDHGMMRKDERKQVVHTFKDQFGIHLIPVDASDLFLGRLAGVDDPEQKRKIIGRTFVEVFESESKKLNNVTYLAQGTLYPDVIESAVAVGPAQTIKSHHNVGGLPEKMHLKLLEPLRDLFKDEVRQVGRLLGLPEVMVERHPFPGPGLAVRILGEITREGVAVLQEADAIFIDMLHQWGLYNEVSQAFAVLLPVRTVGIMGDERTYEQVCAIRSVSTTDFMTADWSRLPYDFLGEVSSRIVNEVKGINRVVFDITSKPPGTIEWE